MHFIKFNSGYVSVSLHYVTIFVWCMANSTSGTNIEIADVTSGSSVLGVMGPKARDLMRKAAPFTDWSNEAFPFGSWQEIEIGNHAGRQALECFAVAKEVDMSRKAKKHFLFFQVSVPSASLTWESLDGNCTCRLKLLALSTTK